VGWTREQAGLASLIGPKGRGQPNKKRKNTFLFIFQLKSPQTQILKVKMTFLERGAKTKVVLNFEIYNLVKKNKAKISIVLKIEV
jgi:hypothetical protein